MMLPPLKTVELRVNSQVLILTISAVMYLADAGKLRLPGISLDEELKRLKLGKELVRDLPLTKYGVDIRETIVQAERIRVSRVSLMVVGVS